MNLADKSPNCENGRNRPIQLLHVNANGVSFRSDNFGTDQRLFSIYDGPAYQERNVYLTSAEGVDACTIPPW